MNYARSVLLILVAGLFTGTAIAADGVLSKDKLGTANYCHMRFPAIRSSTLGGDHPQLKDADTGDVIDFYGSCDESPTGADQVQSQILEQGHHYNKFPGGRY